MIDKCHMCRERLDKINVYKIYVKIADITVPFYFCREIEIVDFNLHVRNRYIIHNILAAHNLVGFMDKLEMDEDVIIDLRAIDKDMFLTSKITDNLGRLKQNIDIGDEVMGDDTEAIIEEHYYEQYAWPYISLTVMI
jgi:hypothetical protein